MFRVVNLSNDIAGVCGGAGSEGWRHGLVKSEFFTTDPDADLNGDGVVNFVDLGTMKSSFFGQPGPSGSSKVTMTGSSNATNSSGIDKAFDSHLK